jgi:Lysine methyltransferase
MNHNSVRAQGRWKILQQAILRQQRENEKSNEFSIHNFPGFQMIPLPKPFVEAGSAVEANDIAVAFELQNQLMKEFCGDSEDYFICEYSIPIQEYDEHGAPQVAIETSRPVLPQYIHVYTRETSAHKPQRIRSLSQLVSHHEKDRIDNTGNICVWDSERTMCWAILRSITSSFSSPILPSLRHVLLPDLSQAVLSMPTSTTILELGSGMAGLAILSLASLLYAKFKLEAFTHQFHFSITDGRLSCVRNNERNVQIMRTIGVLPKSSFRGMTLDCHQLLWSTEHDIANNVEKKCKIADCVLVADCTHFEHYHGELYWTMVTYAKDQVIMCQPNRSPSWERFMKLVDAVNQNVETHPLLQMSEQRYTEIQQKHDSFIQNDTNYEPTKHLPRLFIFNVLRAPTQLDRQCVIDHIRSRR